MGENDEVELSPFEINKTNCGIILGLWDQEKTPVLIKDLDSSVSLIETKCKQLLQQLVLYRKYLEKLHSFDNGKFLFIFKELHTNNRKNHHLISGSDPDINFRKKMIKLQELEEKFEANFEEELLTINNTLREAAQKIGLKDNVFLFPTENYVKDLNANASDLTEMSWPDLCEKFISMSEVNAQTKSEPTISELAASKHNSGFSKITKNELKLYQKLSRLSLRKGKNKKIFNYLEANKLISSRLKKKGGFRHGIKSLIKKIPKRNVKNDDKSPKVSKRKFPRNSDKKFYKKKRSESSKEQKNKKQFNCRGSIPLKQGPNNSNKVLETTTQNSLEEICKSLADAINERNFMKISMKQKQKDSIKKSNTTGKNMPLSSTVENKKTKTNNYKITKSKLGTSSSVSSIQDKKWSYACPARTQNAASLVHDSYALSKANTVENLHIQSQPWKISHNKQNVEHVETGEKIWIAKYGKASGFKKLRFKYTSSSPESFLEFHKSTTKQFTNGHKSYIESESKKAYAVGSKIMLSDCQRTDFFHFGSDDSNETFIKLKMEWNKVCSAFIRVSRKYSNVKDQMIRSNLVPSQTEVKALESEIDSAIKKYQEFLKFYCKFLHLEHQLKTLKIACETKISAPPTSFSFDCQKKFNTRSTTNSIAMKKIFRQIQDLQQQINMQ